MQTDHDHLLLLTCISSKITRFSVCNYLPAHQIKKKNQKKRMATLHYIELESLKCKSAIVTGGSRGIGAQTCLELARYGANIAIVYHSDQSTKKAQDVASQIEKLDRRAVIIKEDLGNLECGEKIVLQAR